MELSEMNSKTFKLASATIGASALVGMGVFTVALSSDNDAATVVSEPEITLGETTTSETGATELETSLAVPEVTAEPPDGFGP
jgi:hypothetical protein